MLVHIEDVNDSFSRMTSVQFILQKELFVKDPNYDSCPQNFKEKLI